MKKLSILCLLFLSSVLAVSQSFTNVTATLQDTSAQVWANATINATFVPAFNNSGQPNNQGHPITDTPQITVANSSGVFNLILDDNSVVAPAGSYWQLAICSNTSAPCTLVNVSVHGASMNISSIVNPILNTPRINAAPTIQRAYNDSEVSGGPGSQYWNTISNQFEGCVGIIPCTWVNIGGGGGGGINIVNGTSNQICITNPTTTPVIALCNPTTTPGNLTVSGNGSVTGTFGVTGATTLGGLTINGIAVGVSYNGVINPTSSRYSGIDVFNKANNAVASSDCPTAGCTIYFPPGAYSVSTPLNGTGTKNLILQGSGKGNTVITWTGGAVPIINANATGAGMVSVRDMTIIGQGVSNPGNFGVYINGSQNFTDANNLEIQDVGDNAIEVVGNTSQVVLHSNYIHHNLNGNCLEMNGSGVENLSFFWNECFNNKGGANLLLGAGGTNIFANDIESGSTGNASLPMLNVTAANVNSSGNTYGLGGSTTSSFTAVINGKGFTSTGDAYSIGTTSQTAVNIKVNGNNATFIGTTLSAPGGGGGTALLFDAFASDIYFLNPTLFNTFTTKLTDSGSLHANIISGDAALARAYFLGTMFVNGVFTSGVATGTAPMIINSTTPIPNLTAVNHPIVQICANTASCSHLIGTNILLTYGALTLSGGTVTITGLTPAYVGVNSYNCQGQDLTTKTNPVNITNVSASSFTISGTGTDTVTYFCYGQ